MRVSRLSQHFMVSLAIRRKDSKVGLGRIGSVGVGVGGGVGWVGVGSSSAGWGGCCASSSS